MFKSGELALGVKAISACHAEDVACSVGKTMTKLGARDYSKDPRTACLDFQLACQQASYRKCNKPKPKKPEIPKPMLVQIVQQCANSREKQR
jgi:hypothetical protein